MAVAGKLTYKTELDTSGVQKAGSTVKSIIAGLGITKVISTAMNEIKNSTDDAIKRLDTLNNFPKVMSNLGIASEDADKSIKKMSDRLSGLPTTLDQGASAVQRFTSANGNVEKSTDIFLALNNAILAGGASTEIQASALEQLSQAYAKGKPDMMEWRTALTAMPAQLKQVADAMGYVSSDELGEALRNGTISMDEFMDTITKLNTEGVDGFQSFEEQARNSTGGIATSISVAKTQIVKGVTDIINALNERFEDTKFGSLSGFISQIGVKAKEGLDLIAKVISGEISTLDFGKSVIEMITNFIKKTNEQAPKIIETGMKMISDFIIGISSQLPELIPVALDTVLTIVESLIDNIDLLIDAGISLTIGLTEGLINALPILINKVPIIIDKLVTKLTDPEMLGKLIKASARLITELSIGLILAIPSLLKSVYKINESIVNGIENIVTSMSDIGKNIVAGIWSGISNSLSWIKSKLTSWVGNVTNFIKKMFKIGSPSKLMADEVGQWLPKGIAVGIDTNTDSVEKSMDDMYDEMNKTIKMENAKLNFDVMSNDIYNKSLQLPSIIDLSANFEGNIPVQLNLDGEKIYDNQQKISIRKNLQYGGIR